MSTSVLVSEAPKPRARWNPYGVGYWTVRDIRNGTVYQGVGLTLEDAHASWLEVHAEHPV